MACQRRLGDTQTQCRAPEVQFIGDGHEIAEAAQVKHLCLFGINSHENSIGTRFAHSSDCHTN
ncbi:hypothetical protein EMIT0111MI5_110108 [Burkholderia sp. IT-111MI5]